MNGSIFGSCYSSCGGHGHFSFSKAKICQEKDKKLIYYKEPLTPSTQTSYIVPIVFDLFELLVVEKFSLQTIVKSLKIT